MVIAEIKVSSVGERLPLILHRGILIVNTRYFMPPKAKGVHTLDIFLQLYSKQDRRLMNIKLDLSTMMLFYVATKFVQPQLEKFYGKNGCGLEKLIFLPLIFGSISRPLGDPKFEEYRIQGWLEWPGWDCRRGSKQKEIGRASCRERV